MNSQNIPQNSEVTCCVCLSVLPSHMMCTLNPCMHEAVCPDCALQLRVEQCPICRSSIDTVSVKANFQPGDATRTVTLTALLEWKRQIHKNAKFSVPLVVFIGDKHSHKAQLIAGIKVAYARENAIPAESFYSTPFAPQADFFKAQMSVRFDTIDAPWELGPNPQLWVNTEKLDIPLVVICARSMPNDIDNSILNLNVQSMLTFLRIVLENEFKAICFVTMEEREVYDTSERATLERELETKLIGDHIVKVMVARHDSDESRSLGAMCATVLSEDVNRAGRNLLSTANRYQTPH